MSSLNIIRFVARCNYLFGTIGCTKKNEYRNKWGTLNYWLPINEISFLSLLPHFFKYISVINACYGNCDSILLLIEKNEVINAEILRFQHSGTSRNL